MKPTKTLLVSAALILGAMGVQAADFVQNGNFLTVQLKQHQNYGPSQIRLQVVGDRIIRVQATAEQGFRNKQSLIIVPQNSKAKYKVEEQGDDLIITTAAMRAVLNEATGQITFYDLKDQVLLKEVAQGGKTFKPFTVPDREIGVDIAKVPEAQKHGWSWRALFDSPDNEAFYGLGQHQSEELNMKGKNEDLFQYNTKVSVPFVISNKNYGILWDSYSYCRWGNPDDYLQLNRAFKLYDKDGKEGQLTGTYVDKNGQKIVRGEDSIYFEYAMPTGCSMNIMMKAMPNRTFDVGIAEGHAVTFSGGMAKDGLIPFCNIYSSFAQRAYDNIIHDMALLNLPVVLCLDRAGLVGEDGPTHHGAFDLAALRPIPHLTIASPMDEHELRNLMYSAQLPDHGSYVIRYPRGCGVLVDWRNKMEEIKTGTGRKLKDGEDVAVLTIGPIGNDAIHAIEEVEKETEMSVAHYDMRFVKPLDENILTEVGKKFKRIVTIEDGARMGGMGSAVLEWMSDHGYQPQITRLGLPDEFVEHGTVEQLREIVHLDHESIKNAIIGK